MTPPKRTYYWCDLVKNAGVYMHSQAKMSGFKTLFRTNYFISWGNGFADLIKYNDVENSIVVLRDRNRSGSEQHGHSWGLDFNSQETYEKIKDLA